MFPLRATIKSFLPQTLLGRSMLILIVPVLLLQIFTVYIFFERHWSRVTDRLAGAVAGEMAVIADVVDGAGTGAARERALTQILNYTSKHLDFVISFHPGEKIAPVTGTASPMKQLVIDTLTEALQTHVGRPFTVRLIQDEAQVDIHIQLRDGVLNAVVSQRRLYSSSSYIFLLWMVGTSFLLSLIAIFFMRRQIRPIRKLAIAAERFGKGQDVPRFKPEGAREVRAAARAFLDMHDRIKRQVEQRTAMLAGVSHDLRTPLTRLKLGLSLMPEGRDRSDLEGDVKAMEQMIAAYLDFIRGGGDEVAAAIDVSALLRDGAAQMGRVGAKVEVDVPPNLTLTGRAGALSRAVLNILNNAHRYARHVRLSARRDGAQIRIVIEDDGPGIPAAQRAEALRPFVRLDPARQVGEGGAVGLGLTIAQEMIQSHGGEMTLSDSVDLGGLQVMITLPV